MAEIMNLIKLTSVDYLMNILMTQICIPLNRKYNHKEVDNVSKTIVRIYASITVPLHPLAISKCTLSHRHYHKTLSSS